VYSDATDVASSVNIWQDDLFPLIFIKSRNSPMQKLIHKCGNDVRKKQKEEEEYLEFLNKIPHS
jgi:hypothetical protein